MFEIQKYKTYIDGLDEMLGGGIPEGHVIMVSGTAGTMKSSLSYNILYNNAIINNSKSVYISLEQGRRSILRQMENMGFVQDKITDLIQVVDIGIIRKKMEGGSQLWIELFKMYAQKLKETLDYKILVVDSMEALEILAKFKNHRLELFELFKWLRKLKTSVILITEVPQIYSLAFKDLEDLDIFSRHKEGYLVDGIIHLKMEKKGEFEVERRIRCVKMRGTKHKTGFGALLFENKKFQVIPIISG